MKYEVKRPVVENISQAAVEESSNETPIDHNDDIKSVKNSVNEFKEALHYLTHEIKQLKSAPVQEPVEESTPIYHNDDFESMKKSAPVQEPVEETKPIESDLGFLKYEVRRL